MKAKSKGSSMDKEYMSELRGYLKGNKMNKIKKSGKVNKSKRNED